MTDIGAFEGIAVALTTPLLADGRLDAEGLKRLVDYQIEGGVHAVFPLGTTGEASYLTRQQRVEIVGTVVQHVAGRVPVLAGAIEMSADRAIEEALAVAEAGPDCIVVTPPFYGDANDDEVVEHFRRIASAVDVPLMAYDIPFKTFRKLTPGIVRRLVSEGTIVGLKDSSGNFREFREVVTELADSPVALLTGTEHMVDAAVLMGASGAVLGLANVAPRSFVEIYDAARAGDWARARVLQEKMVRLTAIMNVGVAHGLSFDSSIFGALKHVQASDGILESSTISSGTPLPEAAKAQIDEIVRSVRAS
jgi:4-hydroxy-tetrahydrodipicolinate synthase